MLTFYDLFRERFRNLDESEKILKQINERLDKSTETVNPEILYPIYYILNTDPCYYWNDSIRKNTLSNLENLNINNSNTIVINNDILNHFFIGYNSYIELSKVIQDLSPINYSNVIKNRMYRIPTYVSIVEGCLTNLLRVIILILDQTTEKDLSAQKKLKPICDALVSKGFEEIIKYIDVDIRNAINHGGILFKEDGKRIEFNYTKGGKVLSKELLDYEFDKLIDNVFDTASGLLLALCQFINNNINLINIDKYENNYVSSNLLCMELSIPSIICKCINESIDSSQLNVHIHIKNTDVDFLISTFPIDSKQESICVDPMLSEDDLNKISEKIEFFAWKEKKEKPQKNNVNVYEATLITNEINSIIKGFCFRYLPENISFTEALLKISDHFTEDTNKKEQLYKDFSEREALSTQVIEEFGIVFLHARTAVIEQSQFIVVLPEGDHFKDSYFKKTRAIIVMLIPEDDERRTLAVSSISNEMFEDEEFLEEIKRGQEEIVFPKIKNILEDYFNEYLKLKDITGRDKNVK